MFITSHCKETVPKLMGCLRTLGIPAAAVVDLDLLKGKAVVRDLLEEAGASKSITRSIGSLRSDLEQTFKKLAEQKVPGTAEKRQEAVRNERDKLMKRGGIDSLPDPHDRQTLESFLEQLASYGIFVPPRGELESWLPHLGARKSKKGWIVDIFAKLGSLNEIDGYHAPADGDVWDFMRSIGRWIDRNIVHPGSKPRRAAPSTRTASDTDNPVNDLEGGAAPGQREPTVAPTEEA
jgi:hypothetical protein